MRAITNLKIVLSFANFIFFSPVFSQPFNDYIGAGHSDGITITTSNDHSMEDWDEIAVGENTINGNGLEGKLMEASRFLSQATMGYDMETIQHVAEIGLFNWMQEQFAAPVPSYIDTFQSVVDQVYEWYLEDGGTPEDFEVPGWEEFQYSWWQINLQNKDLLRQRMAYALSQILVVSSNSFLADYGEGLASYYDILSKNAFGNFELLLREITMSPAMGVYLSHYNNPKTDTVNNIHPDENFAREIMQLFSVGLYKMNPDASFIVDSAGFEIPTYDNDQITEMAKIFTGLGPSVVRENPHGYTAEFGVDAVWCDFKEPMAMYEEFHETGEKYLLDGYVTNPSNTGLEDIYEAVHHLSTHPNVAPFMARRLIQHFVKSNPTPEYIERVAAVFEDNGSLIRGDLQAVLRAILLDPEARECSWMTDPTQGKLREPFLRYTHIARVMDKDPPDGLLWNLGFNFASKAKQMVLGSPTVFNFFLPDYVPNGPIEEADLRGPEFQIHDSRTSIGWVNLANDYGFWLSLLSTWEGTEGVFADLEPLEPKSRDPEVLLNRLDLMYTHGLLTEDTRAVIKNSILPLTSDIFWSGYTEKRTRLAWYLLLVSPDYTILK